MAEELRQARRIVVKVGSSLVTNEASIFGIQPALHLQKIDPSQPEKPAACLGDSYGRLFSWLDFWINWRCRCLI